MTLDVSSVDISKMAVNFTSKSGNRHKMNNFEDISFIFWHYEFFPSATISYTAEKPCITIEYGQSVKKMYILWPFLYFGLKMEAILEILTELTSSVI